MHASAKYSTCDYEHVNVSYALKCILHISSRVKLTAEPATRDLTVKLFILCRSSLAEFIALCYK